MTNINKKIAITTGDVNGIGAEVTMKALQRLDLSPENVVIISNQNVLNFYNDKFTVDNYEILNIDFDCKNILPGKITAKSGEFCFQSLKIASELAKSKKIDAIATAPVSKEALHLAGHHFSGQTEVLEHFLATPGQHAEMLFVANDFRVFLLTRHLALKSISLNSETVINKIVNLDKFFTTKLKFENPKFALCALNPHAGENGILGTEEIDILIPAANTLRGLGVNITDPFPADTLFIQASKSYLENKQPPYDCYIACYHDQGLIPIKSIASEKTVNMTIGLDVIRTSPAHGTAFDIAGKNIASEDSMIEAILQAIKI